MSKIIISKEDEAALVYMDWDVKETLDTLQRLFPEAGTIRYYTELDDKHILIEVDDVPYEVDYEGNVQLAYDIGGDNE